jgi:hypothetical protein
VVLTQQLRRTDAALNGPGRQRVEVGLYTPELARRYLAAKLAAERGDRHGESANGP